MKNLAMLVVLLYSQFVAAQKPAQIYRGDTSLTHFNISRIYSGCDSVYVDSLFYLNRDKADFSQDWDLFFDTTMTQLYATYRTVNDTTIVKRYFRNGQLAKAEKTYKYNYIFGESFCLNGQRIAGGTIGPKQPRNYKRYFCNGQLEWEGMLHQSYACGTQKYWFRNGMLHAILEYALPDSALREWPDEPYELIQEQYWTIEGEDTVGFSPIRVHEFDSLFRVSCDEVDDCKGYDVVDEKLGYDQQMTALKKEIYKRVTRSSCKCEFGVVKAQFVIDLSGEITEIEVDSRYSQTAVEVFYKAISELGFWNVGEYNGSPVKVFVKLNLFIEDSER